MKTYQFKRKNWYLIELRGRGGGGERGGEEREGERERKL